MGAALASSVYAAAVQLLGNVEANTTVVFPWGRFKAVQSCQSVDHQLIKDLLVSPNRTNRGPLVTTV